MPVLSRCVMVAEGPESISLDHPLEKCALVPEEPNVG